jgi:adenine-specific DNA-methyltransferase
MAANFPYFIRATIFNPAQFQETLMPTLTWVGKDKVVNHHHDVPFRILNKQYSFASDNHSPINSTQNRIIQGDNLEALKSLLPEFEGKVKCIYIDPPYNTGNEGWVYNDNVNDPKMKKWLGQVVGKEGEDLSRHDKWLCMMYPRLKLLHKLLADDGVILVSIDDNEQAHLKMVMNEIFGASNFVGQIVWEKGRKNDAKLVSTGHEYIFIYVSNKSKLKEKGIIWREKKAGAEEILFEYNRLRKTHGDNYELIEKDLSVFYKSLTKDHPSKKHSRYSRVDQFGVWRDDNMSWPNSGGPTYDVIHPKTGVPCEVPPNGWRYSTPEKMNEMISSGKVIFRKDHTLPPIRKTYLLQVSDDVDDDESAIQVAGSYFYRSALQATTELSGLLGKNVFDYPKDSEILSRWIGYVTSKDAIILDSFAGSGTTAHAVLKLNAQDGGNRRFILVEMMDYAENITAERVRRVINGYGQDNKIVAGLGGGFDYFTIGEPLFLENDNLNEAVGVTAIRDYITYSEGIPTHEQTTPDNPNNPYVLGLNREVAWIFFYETERVTTLDIEFLGTLQFGKHKPVSVIIYADKCLLSPEFMRKHNIRFKKIPRDITRF